MALNATLERFLKLALNSDEAITLLDELLAPDMAGAIEMSGSLAVDSIGEYTGAGGIDITDDVDFTLGDVVITTGNLLVSTSDIQLTLGNVIIDAGDLDVTLGDINVSAGNIICVGNVDGVDVSDLSGNLIAVSVEDSDTSSREENVAGLALSITLANALTITMNAHAADAGEHTSGADATNFPIAAPVATDLASLIVLVTEQLLAYQAHNVDAKLGAAWVFHAAQQAGNDLVAATAPATLADAYVDVNDIKAKYNTHESSAVSHGAGSAHTEGEADAVWGIANLFPDANILPGDLVSWNVLDDGTGNVLGVSAVAATGGITFTFSADPQDDCIISYAAFRAV